MSKSEKPFLLKAKKWIIILPLYLLFYLVVIVIFGVKIGDIWGRLLKKFK